MLDYAATTCLFNEIGAIVSDIDGKQLELNREESSFVNHHGILYCTDMKMAILIRELKQSLS